MASKKLPKLDDVGPLIRRHALAGTIYLLPHAAARQGERAITYPEAVEVLSTGRYTPARDRWSEAHQSWSYAVEGATAEARRLRVAVTFSEDVPEMLIVTLIDLTREE